jgi:arylsulfatase A-like enzyme
MPLRIFLLLLLGVMSLQAEKPNVVLIYADDLGYGDLGCYGASAVKTPRLDQLAAEGLRFTDAHSSSATCTPSRYALLTGEYAFRQKGTGVLPGDAGLIIDPSRTTLAGVFHQAGYRTGVVGKWHLGLGGNNLDWNGEIKPGPLEIGFDQSYIIAATGDRVPCVYVEDHRVVGLDPADPITVRYTGPLDDAPLGSTHPELLKMKPSHGHDMTIVNGISRIGYMRGGKAALWKDEDMADVLGRQAVKFIEQNKEQPFFLYFATHDIHVPRVPHGRFAGKTPLGPRGDVIEELDATAGAVLDALDRLGLAKNTLVIFSSDNGPVVDDGYQDDAVAKLGRHQPAGPWRGGKYSNYEGGTRVPFIVRWPGHITPGTSDALVCQVDLIRSFASLLQQPIASPAAPDSQDVMAALLGQSPNGREALVEHAQVLSLRQGPWKYIRPAKGPPVNPNTGTEMGRDAAGMLFNLATDPGERQNVLRENQDRATTMAAQLGKLAGAPPRPR